MPALEASFAVLFIAIPGPTARAAQRPAIAAAVSNRTAGQARECRNAIAVGVLHLIPGSIRQASIRQIFAAKGIDVLVYTRQRIQG
jgi:hypothetical protein